MPKKHRNRNQRTTPSPSKGTSKKQRLASPQQESLCLLDNNHRADRSQLISGLSYCPVCRAFFYVEPEGSTTRSTLEEALRAVYDLSKDSNIFFEPNCVGLVANLCSPNASAGQLKILQALAEADADYQRSCIKSGEEWNVVEGALKNFAEKNSFQLDAATKVFKAIGRALGRRIPEAEEKPIDFMHESGLIQMLEVSPSTASPGGMVTAKWLVKATMECACRVGLNEESWEVSFKDSRKFIVRDDSVVSLTVYYKGTEIESRKKVVKLERGAEINYFRSNLPSPIVEGVKARLSWEAVNYSKLILVRKTNDYNGSTLDVTSYMGGLEFTARRTEIFELTASSPYGNDSRALVIEVIPTPKFDTSRIPELTSLASLPEIAELSMFEKSHFERLSHQLNNMVLPYSANDLYLSLSRSLTSFLERCEQAMHNLLNQNKTDE